MKDTDVNTRDYWERYIENEWIENDGPGQSRHFMAQLLSHLPASELDWLVRQQLSVLDWGCATGEGTALLAAFLPQATVSGTDFAKSAIDLARRMHPDVQFTWNSEGMLDRAYDVIITSNCLEHFVDPLAVVQGHLEHCRQLYLALVPFQEHPLHAQHFAQFRVESFPETIGRFDRIDLIPFAVDNQYWPGAQVLVVYGSEEYRAQRLSVRHDSTWLTGVVSILRDVMRWDLLMKRSLLDLQNRGRVEQEHARGLIDELERSLADAREQLVVSKGEQEHARGLIDELERSLADAREQLSSSERERSSLLESLNRTNQDLCRSTALLKREERRVLRPIMRQIVYAGRSVGRQLPVDWQEAIRSSMLPLASRLAPSSAEAFAYATARRRRQAALRGGREERTIGSDAYTAPMSSLWKALVESQVPTCTFILFPVIDWEFRFQRPQQLAIALAELGHQVLYLRTDFGNVSGEGYRVFDAPHERVRVVQLDCPGPHPSIYSELPSADQAMAISRSLDVAAAELGVGPIVRFVEHPFWTSIVQSWDEGVLVYDLIDEHADFKGSGSWIPTEESRLLTDADLIVATSDMLAIRTGKPAETVLVRNATDYDHFASVTPRGPAESPVRIGYYGAISHWFDASLVSACARAHPEWQIELIGSTSQANLEDLPRLSNVAFLGEQDYNKIPDFLTRWDVALIPFKEVPLTQSTNPVKAYEYLSAGKPVVATPMPELEALKEWVHLARGPADFTTAVERALAEARDPAEAVRRRTAVRSETWEQRARAIDSALNIRAGRVSIVVLCYGQLELTKACIASIARWTRYPDWELIVVDNASPDATLDWLRDLELRWSRLKIIANTENIGFAAGMNVGVGHASGEYLVLLNNDTQVTPGWLYRLVRHLRTDDHLGLVGPVTNATGNEALIDVAYVDSNEMLTVARRYTSAHRRERLYVERLAFFAVALRTTTWDAIGPLDERFGVGFFEDDDYCRRVREADMSIAIAEDVFVHHELSASFDALGAAEKQRLFENNRRLYEEKWGSWVPHRYRAT